MVEFNDRQSWQKYDCAGTVPIRANTVFSPPARCLLWLLHTYPGSVLCQANHLR